MVETAGNERVAAPLPLIDTGISVGDGGSIPLIQSS